MSEQTHASGDVIPEPKEPITMLEMEEFLFSQTSAEFSTFNSVEQTREHMRGSFRLHRFFVFAWLMHNGVRIPAPLMDDRVHREVGKQKPDEKIVGRPTHDEAPHPHCDQCAPEFSCWAGRAPCRHPS